MSVRPTPARTPAALLKEARPLRALVDQAGRLEKFQRLVEAQLQPAARGCCRVAAFREGSLLLIISDSNWATRIRYQQRRLLRQLQSDETFASLERILIKVQPSGSSAPGLPPPPLLSTGAAEAVRATAEGISDPRLRSALERLARHAERKS